MKRRLGKKAKGREVKVAATSQLISPKIWLSVSVILDQIFG